MMIRKPNTSTTVTILSHRFDIVGVIIIGNTFFCLSIEHGTSSVLPGRNLSRLQTEDRNAPSMFFVLVFSYFRNTLSPMSSVSLMRSNSSQIRKIIFLGLVIITTLILLQDSGSRWGEVR